MCREPKPEAQSLQSPGRTRAGSRTPVNSQTENYVYGKREAAEKIDYYQGEGETPEQVAQRLNIECRKRARQLNYSGTSLQGFLEKTAKLQGFAETADDYAAVNGVR